MKAEMRHLAVAGGEPAFSQPIHVGRPNIPDVEGVLDRIRGVLERRWLSNQGPMVAEFERKAAEFLGVRNFIAICNGTIALELAIRALDLKGEVLVPSFTFVATAHALQWQEITPVFCDIDPRTHVLDPSLIERMITPRTTGIIGVHVWGQPCAIGELTEIANRRGLKLMFDASHAFGCSYGGRKIGNFGAAEVFSFHATKFFNTFEGGAIVTNDDALAKKIRLMKNFGFAGYDNVIYIGTNGKMTEVSAAMGLAGLDTLDYFIDANRRNYRVYQRELAGIPGVRMFSYDERESCNYQYIAVEVDEEQTGISRDDIVKVLHGENVLARRYFYPGCHRMEPYRSLFPHAGLLLPETELLTRRILILPTGSTLDEEAITTICSIIRTAVASSREVNAILKAPAHGVR